MTVYNLFNTVITATGNKMYFTKLVPKLIKAYIQLRKRPINTIITLFVVK